MPEIRTDGENKRWWLPDIPSERRYERVISAAQRIRKQNVWRKNSSISALRMYTTMPIVGFGDSLYVRPAIGSGRRMPLNVIKAVSDALTANVTAEDPKISVVTEGGDWALQQSAQGLEKFLEGEFYGADMYDRAKQVVLDGCGIFGSGWWYLCIEGKDKDAHVCAERCYPPEILIDDKMGAKGWRHLSQIGRQQWIDRDVLEEMYKDDPAKLRFIENAKQMDDPETGVPGFDAQADQLLVTEMWHRKSGPNAVDGRYCRAIIDGTLEDEEWEYEWLPFVPYTRAHAPFGCWGIPIAQSLDGIQHDLNDISMRISKAYRLLGAGHVLCERGAEVNFSQWDNEIGSKVEYTGPIPPQIVVPTVLVAPEIYAQVVRLVEWAHDLEGVSQNAAQGEAPKQLQSGKAIQDNLDVQDRRQQVAIHRYHHSFLEIARIWLELAREIVQKHNPNYGAKAMVKRGQMRRVLLKSVDLPEEKYLLKLWETDALSDEPAARMGQVERMSNAGWISPDTAKRLLRMPDLEHEQDLENASYNCVESMIDRMLNEGVYMAPIPTLNLGMPDNPGQAYRQVQLASVKAVTDGRPYDRIQLLLDWLTDAKAVMLGIGGDVQSPQLQASAPGTPVVAPQAGVTPMMGGGGPVPPPGAAPPPIAPPAAA